MLGAEPLGHLPGVRQLVVRGGGGAEADAERRDAAAWSTSRMLAATTLESTPPDRNAPSGTSLTSRSRTASRISPARPLMAELTRIQPRTWPVLPTGSAQ